MDVNNDLPISIIFHCGGRGGVHPTWQKHPLPILNVAFEPESEAWQEMAREKQSPPLESGYECKLLAVNAALAETPSRRQLHIYSSPDLSSFLSFNSEASHRYRYADITLTKIVELDCTTLDLAAKSTGQYPQLLCIDVQGAALEVLRGASQLLARSILGIRVEVELIPLYQHEALAHEIMAYLFEKGFHLLRFETCGQGLPGISTDCGPFSQEPNDGKLAWADALFYRVPPFQKHNLLETSHSLLQWLALCQTWQAPSLGFDLLYEWSLDDSLKSVHASFNSAQNRWVKEWLKKHMKPALHPTNQRGWDRLAQDKHAKIRAELSQKLAKLFPEL